MSLQKLGISSQCQSHDPIKIQNSMCYNLLDCIFTKKLNTIYTNLVTGSPPKSYSTFAEKYIFAFIIRKLNFSFPNPVYNLYIPSGVQLVLKLRTPMGFFSYTLDD